MIPIQASLLDDSPLPPGLAYEPEFLTREEEAALRYSVTFRTRRA